MPFPFTSEPLPVYAAAPLLLLLLLSVELCLAGAATGTLALDSSPAGTSSLLADVYMARLELQVLCRKHGTGMRATKLLKLIRPGAADGCLSNPPQPAACAMPEEERAETTHVLNYDASNLILDAGPPMQAVQQSQRIKQGVLTAVPSKRAYRLV
jgi:hypothetical protein